MKSIADALVYAVAYIDIRGGEDDDADVGALESIAGELSSTTDEERDALAAAADRALQAESKGARRTEFMKDYSRWMEHMFGDDDWSGNKRK